MTRKEEVQARESYSLIVLLYQPEFSDNVFTELHYKVYKAVRAARRLEAFYEDFFNCDAVVNVFSLYTRGLSSGKSSTQTK